MTDWQPIDTAPKDGTKIFGVSRQWWTPINGDHRWAYSPILVTFWMSDRGKWEFGCYAQPTHWLSIPELPTEGGAA